jgi:hypothetical protein
VKYYKLRLRSDRTLYLAVLSSGVRGLCGRRINPQTREDYSYLRADGVIVDRHELILWGAVKWIQPMRENPHYGDLEPDGERLTPEKFRADPDAANVERERAEAKEMSVVCGCGHSLANHVGTTEKGGWGYDGACALDSCACRGFFLPGLER